MLRVFECLPVITVRTGGRMRDTAEFFFFGEQKINPDKTFHQAAAQFLKL